MGRGGAGRGFFRHGRPCNFSYPRARLGCGRSCLCCAGSKFIALLPEPLLFLGDSQRPRPSGTPLDHRVRAFEEVPVLPLDLVQLSK